jgi:TolA-binding protein
MRRFAAVVAALLIGLPGVAPAQIDSREGIALQNQILQLRQEVEMLRRGGAGATQSSGGGSIFGGGGSRPSGGGELTQTLLERVNRLEEELRTVRGRAEQSEFRERQLREQVEKLQGDLDFRLQQLEGQRQGSAPPSARPAASAAAAAPATTSPAVAAPAAAPARPPQRALSEGQAALGRRDYAAAEAAAREVIAARDSTRMTDAQILLGEALLGRRNGSAAFTAFDEAYRRNPNGSRSQEALLGIANALILQNNTRDACTVLRDVRAGGQLAERATDARRRAQCRA